LVAQVSRQARTAAQVEDAAKRAADAADEAKKSVKDVQSLVTSAKSDVAAVRNDLEAIQKLAKGQMPPGKSDAEARKDREAMEKAAEEAKARAVATKADADAARKDREAAQKSLEEAKAHAAAAKNDAQLAQKARREVQMGTGSVPADVVTKVELARAVEDLKKDASAARKSAEQTSANLGQFQSQADEQRRSVVDALKSLREEVAKLASGPVGKGITAEQLERIVGEVANRVSAAAAQYDWQSPVALRGPLGRIRQWYYPPAPPSRVPQVTARPTEAAPQASTEGAGGTAPAQVPGKPAQPPASAATQQLVDAKLKILGEPASQEPNPLMAGEIFSRGASAYFLGETEEALDYFVAAIRQDPKNALYRYYLGLTLRRLGRPLEAEVQVRAGRRLESPTWRYGIGSSLQRVQGPDRDWLERLRLEM
jgi:tetratricopeptide (TPR) repeat protein